MPCVTSALAAQNSRQSCRVASPRFRNGWQHLDNASLENLLDATNAYSLIVDNQEQLAGLPADALAAARQRAEQAGEKGYKLTLEAPCYLAVMQFAERRALRQTIYEAYSKRASEFGDARRDNTMTIVDTLKLRAEEAHLLGLSNFAELSLVPKMAESPAEVVAFLNDLARRAKPFALHDTKELRAFARSELGNRTDGSLGCDLCIREAARTALRVFRTGSKTVLSGAARAGRPVPSGGDLVLGAHQA